MLEEKLFWGIRGRFGDSVRLKYFTCLKRAKDNATFPDEIVVPVVVRHTHDGYVVVSTISGEFYSVLEKYQEPS